MIVLTLILCSERELGVLLQFVEGIEGKGRKREAAEFSSLAYLL